MDSVFLIPFKPYSYLILFSGSNSLSQIQQQDVNYIQSNLRLNTADPWKKESSTDQGHLKVPECRAEKGYLSLSFDDDSV